jgi:hypothetical protein
MCNAQGRGDPAGIRTRDPRLKRPLLYRLSYRISNEGAKIQLYVLSFKGLVRENKKKYKFQHLTLNPQPLTLLFDCSFSFPYHHDMIARAVDNGTGLIISVTPVNHQVDQVLVTLMDQLGIGCVFQDIVVIMY